MMRAEPYEEDPNVNVLQSGMMIGEDKGKQLEEIEWVRKTLEKEVNFDLERLDKPSWKQRKAALKLLLQEFKISSLEKWTNPCLPPLWRPV